MSDLPKDQDAEQLNNASASGNAPQTPEYSLEEIMNEFGGWSRQESPAPEPETPAPEPEKPAPEPPGQTPPQPAEAAPEERPEPPGEAVPDNVIAFVPAPSVPKADMMADTLRFAPVAAEKPAENAAPEQKVWTYRGEPEPPEDDSSPDGEDKKAVRREKKAAAREKKREKQLARFQRRQQKLLKKKERRDEPPEIVYGSLQEACDAYAKGTSLQLRMFLSVLLSLASLAMLALGQYPLGGFDYAASARLFSVLMLAAMFAQALLCYDVFVDGVAQMLRLRFDHSGLLLVLTLAAAGDAFFAIAAGRVPFCPVVSAELTIALWGRLDERRAKRKTLKAVSAMETPSAAVREEKAWHGKDCIFRAAGDADEFVRRIEQPDAVRRAMRVYAPSALGATLALSFLASRHGGGEFLWTWTAMLLAAYPMGAALSFARPFAIQSKRLFRSGGAIAGWFGARALGGECGLAIEDNDLFPKANVTLNGMKIYSDRSVSQIIGYAAAVVETAGSGLVPLFQEMMKNQNGRHYTVDTFRRYEGGGLGAEIRGDVILMGSLAFMKLMKVRMPEGTKVKQAVYLSINGDLAGVFALNYAPASAARSSLIAAVRAKGLVPILATRDFMITPQFLKHRYKVSTDRIEFPTVEERARLSSPEAVKDGVQGALMARASFNSFVSTVTAGRGLCSAARGSLAVAVTGALLGTALLFFLTFTGAAGAVTCWNLLLYELLWLVPGLLITSLVGRS